MVYISVVFYYLVLQLILSLFLKVDRSMLYCGISAFSPVRGLSREQGIIAATKMKLIALYNQSRGTHGCGIYVNGQLFKGGGDLKLVANYLGEKEFMFPSLDAGHVCIIHTRAATHGAQIQENNHPFLVGEEDRKTSIVGCHNGQISNIWALMTKYKIDHSKIHVDSLGLYMLIHKEGLKVLDEYKGAAALIWTKPSEPGSLYIYHGESKKTKKGEPEEERPMFYVKTEQGLFFSSIAESLFAVRDNEEEIVYIMPHNIVQKVTNGKWTNIRTKVERGDVNVEPPTYYYNSANTATQWREENYGVPVGAEAWRNRTTTTIIPDESKIWRETLPIQANHKTRIFFWKGRYWHNTSEGKDPLLCHGELWLTKKGEISTKAYYNTKAYYFWSGVRLMGEDAFKTVKEEGNKSWGFTKDANNNFALRISKFSTHPVTNLLSEALTMYETLRYAWYINENRCKTLNFTPMFSSRTYFIKDSYMDEVKSSEHKDKLVLTPRSTDLFTAPKTDAVIINPTKPETGFDRYYKTIEEALCVLTYMEMAAIMELCEEKMQLAQELLPDRAEVQRFALGVIEKSIADIKTIRQTLSDTTEKKLDTFMSMMDESHKDIGVDFYSMVINRNDKESSIVEDDAPIDAAAMRDFNTSGDIDDIDVNPQDEEAADAMQDVVDIMSELNVKTDELSILETSEYAQKCALCLYNGIENLKHKLAEISDAEGFTDISKDINQTITTKVQV